MNNNGAAYLPWTQDKALFLCRLVESVCPRYGCHVALTGGILYKHGPRKDCDLLFYRIRQVAEINLNGLLGELRNIGFDNIKGGGWCYKATFDGLPVDIFFPEEQTGAYPPEKPKNLPPLK